MGKVVEIDLRGLMGINLCKPFPNEYRNSHYPHLRFVGKGKDSKVFCDKCGASRMAVEMYDYGFKYYDHTAFMLKHYDCEGSE